MQMIDILRMQSLDAWIMVQELWHDADGRLESRQTGVMRVRNITWGMLRRYEYKNVTQIVPQERGGKKYLFIQVDDREKCFYDR